jgi:hypothetical protein
MPDDFVITNSHGRPMITVNRDDRGLINLAVRARRNGDPVTITPEEARDLAGALTRRWPMIGPPTAEAVGSGDWWPA